MISSVLSVAAGGALGAVLRFFLGLWVTFPFGTVLVNVTGSFLIGVVWVATKDGASQQWQPFIMTGLLGGFTTFSAFSLDALRLVEAGRLAMAGGYIVGSVLASVLACALAIWLARGAV